MTRTELRRGVDERIMKLKAAIDSLPDEFTPEAWELWQDYNEQIRGLVAIRTRFCEPPREAPADPFPEVLYD